MRFYPLILKDKTRVSELERGKISCRVWSTFQAPREDGSLVKLRIQDLPENRRDDAVNLFLKYYIHDETLLKMAGISRNPEAVQEYQLLISQLIKNPSSLTMICCVDEEEGPQIVGVSLMSLIAVERQDLFRTSQPKTDEMRLYLKLEEIFDLRNKMKELQIASFYDDIGLIVHPRFRKLGIASELVKARYMACVAHDVAAIGASLTSLGTEKIAQKNHWHTVKQVRLDELGQHCGATCFDAAVNTIRLVIWKNPEFRTH